MNRTLRDLFILIALFGSIWAAIAYLPVVWSAPDFTITEEQEQKLGDVLVQEAILTGWDNITASQPLADSALRVIYTRLLAQVPQPHYNYKFYILDDTTVNAFTIAGGHIFVFKGLIQFCQTPEELAAVLAHEIGHAEKRHVAKKLTQDLSLEIITSVISGGNESYAQDAAKLLFSSKYSRAYEKQADAFALDLLTKASINPYSMAHLFERMEDEGLAYDRRLEFIMSHPHADTRISDIMLYQTPYNFKEQPLGIDWEAVQQSF